uniref:Secreted protein n=1 Tax=Panagrellus redivivus TaxID=6233 RepID=A0A7E4ZXI0_PANRE
MARTIPGLTFIAWDSFPFWPQKTCNRAWLDAFTPIHASATDILRLILGISSNNQGQHKRNEDTNVKEFHD